MKFDGSECLLTNSLIMIQYLQEFCDIHIHLQETARSQKAVRYRKNYYAIFVTILMVFLQHNVTASIK